MSVELQLVDFTATGVLGSAWTATGGTFSQDGQRAYPTTPATYSRAVLVAAPNLTASVPIKARYEADVTLPSSFPATGVLRAGLVFQGGYAHFLWHRSSGGGSTIFDFFARHGTTGTETSYFSTSVSLSAGETYRLRSDVRYTAGGLIVECAYSTDGGQTFTALFLSTPSVGAWNTATGQSLTSFATADKRGGIVAQSVQIITPPIPNVSIGSTALFPVMLDNFRVTDIGSLADAPTINTAPTLTAYPDFTSITVDEEDDGTVQTLSVQPSYALQCADEWVVIEHPYDGGYTATVGHQTVRRRVWNFHWDAMGVSDIIAFGTLRAAVRGRQSAFTWAHPTTGETIRIKFDAEPSVSLVAPSIWQAEATVREVPSDA